MNGIIRCLRYSILAFAGLWAIRAAPAFGQSIVVPAPAYRYQWSVEYRERHIRVPRFVVETSQREVRNKVRVPVWETIEREETYTVRRPVYETVMRDEQYTVYDQVTTAAPQTIGAGQWVDQRVQLPGRMTTRLRWIPGGWTSDPVTGRQFWVPGGLRPTQVQRPGAVVSKRVWQPMAATTAVPQTTFAPRVETRQVPVRQVRYVEEQQVRKVPARVCRWVEQEQVVLVPETRRRLVWEDRVIRIPRPVCRRETVVPTAVPAPPGELPAPPFEPGVATPQPTLPPGEPVPETSPGDAP